MFETLESRRLLSAAMTFADGASAKVNGAGELQIKGGNKINNLAIIENNGTVDVMDLITGESTRIANVKGITINSNGGADTVLYRGTTIGAEIRGGNGRDVITVLDAGSASSSVD